MSKGLGLAFKTALKKGETKIGLFLNSTSPIIAEQLSHSGYDWLLVDAQHGPMTTPLLSQTLSAIASNDTVSLVRVGSSSDRQTIQLSLDGGADGVAHYGADIVTNPFADGGADGVAHVGSGADRVAKRFADGVADGVANCGVVLPTESPMGMSRP